MLCKKCSTVVSDSVVSCPSCGNKTFYKDPALVQAIVSKDTKTLEKMFTTSPKLRDEIAREMAEATIAPIQEAVDVYITTAHEGIVTYETLYNALETGHIGKNSDNNRFTNALSMYYGANDAWSCYSNFLHANRDLRVLLSAFHTLSTGNLRAVLNSAGFERKKSEYVLSYPGITRWLSGCVLTMLFMNILRKDVLKQIDSDDFDAYTQTYGENFWEECGIFAKIANRRYTWTKTDKTVIETLRDERGRSVEEEKREQVEKALLKETAELILAGEVNLTTIRDVAHFAAKRIPTITRDYELIVFSSLLAFNWRQFEKFDI